MFLRLGTRAPHQLVIFSKAFIRVFTDAIHDVNYWVQDKTFYPVSELSRLRN